MLVYSARPPTHTPPKVIHIFEQASIGKASRGIYGEDEFDPLRAKAYLCVVSLS